MAVAYATTRLGTPYWLTNDDATMSQLASGEFTGDPSPHLVFVSTLLGEPIAFLYTIAPAISWYAWFLVASLIAGLASLYSILRSWVGWSWIVFAITIVIWTTLRPNFTVTAITVASTGVLLAANAIRAGRFSVGALVLVILGMSWRADAGALAVLLMLPLLFFGFRAKVTHSRWPSIAMGASLPVTVFLFSRIHSWCWSGVKCSDWQDFAVYNTLRGTFHTSPRGDAFGSAGDMSGTWSDPAVKLFLNFSYPDDSLFGLTNMQQVNASAPFFLQLQGGGLLSHIHYAFVQISPLLLIFFAGIAMFIVPLMFLRSDRIPFVGRVVAILSVPFIVLIGVSLIRLPFAIALGASIATIAGLAVIAQWRTDSGHVISSNAQRLMALIAGSTLLGSWILAGPVNVRYLEHQASTLISDGQRFMNRLAVHGGTSTIFGQGNLADYLSQGPFRTDQRYSNLPVLLSGWTAFSPAYQERKSALGIQDVYSQLEAGVLSDGRPLMFAGSATNAYLTAELLKSRLGDDVSFEAKPVAPLTTSENDFVGEIFLWRFVEQ